MAPEASDDDTGTPDSEDAVSIGLRQELAELDQTAAELADRLLATAPGMLAEHRRLTRGFERRLRKHWGEALDLFYVIAVCDEEAGDDFNRTHRPVAVEQKDHVFEALTGLHARACRTAYEVHHMLSGGFGMNALARSRTLHELAVTANVIQEFGRQVPHTDLAERFLLHEVISSWKDAQVYQANWEAPGEQPFGPDELAEMKHAYDAVIERFGRPFREPYGWAANLLGNPNPKFDQIERLVALSHLRPQYRWASHEVHSDAKGWALNRVERGDGSYLLTGQTNDGLADPGQMALISLHQATVSLLLSIDPPNIQDLRILMAMERLLDQAMEAFIRGDQSVTDAEERFQAKQQRISTRAKRSRASDHQ